MKASRATSARWLPCSFALLISRKSLETPPLIPRTPDFLLRMLSIWSGVSFSLFIMNCKTAGSTSPLLVPIIKPSRGVRPIEVSTHFPPIDADTLAPFPKWQTITFAFLGSRLANLIASLETNLWLVPWKP